MHDLKFMAPMRVRPNTNPATGIAYGYISANALHDDIVQTLQDGTDVYYAEALAEGQKEVAETDEAQAACREQGIGDGDFTAEAWEDKDVDEKFEATLLHVQANWDGSRWQDQFNDSYQPDEPVHKGELDGVKYRTSWLGGALNVFIAFSPCITHQARRASPCVPGCGILDTLDGSETSYDVPPEWRRTEDE